MQKKNSENSLMGVSGIRQTTKKCPKLGTMTVQKIISYELVSQLNIDWKRYSECIGKNLGSKSYLVALKST